MHIICMSHCKGKIFIAMLVYLRVRIPIPPGKAPWLATPISLGFIMASKTKPPKLGVALRHRSVHHSVSTTCIFGGENHPHPNQLATSLRIGGRLSAVRIRGKTIRTQTALLFTWKLVSSSSTENPPPKLTKIFSRKKGLFFFQKERQTSSNHCFSGDMVVFRGRVEITWGNEKYPVPGMQHFAATRSNLFFFLVKILQLDISGHIQEVRYLLVISID